MRLVVALLCLSGLLCGRAFAQPSSDGLHLIPRPSSVRVVPGCFARADDVLAALSRTDFAAARRRPDGDPQSAGREIVLERWRALDGHAPPAARHRAAGNVRARADLGLSVRFARAAGGPASASQAYRLRVGSDAVEISSAGNEGVFYAFVTLSQLPHASGSGWLLPCVTIEDQPALRWRILSDDISRGPLPTMRYFKERIRTIASFKMNGYAPYAEHVVFDPKAPLAAPLDGLTADELRELDAYAKRYFVELIPQQQTFAHMHNSLRWERYAPLAETPHGYLLAPANPGGLAYAQELIHNQLAAVPHPPFFHLGADEPVDLGRGRSQEIVAQRGEAAVYTQFVSEMARFVAAQGTRPMIWDDAVSRHPELFGLLPASLVFVNWHYGVEPSYLPFIERIARGGFDQFVAPAARNWNELYPDIDEALSNIDRFVADGKRAGVLGAYMTVWHDDGETLFEATWFPVIYAAASAWESGSVERERFTADFPAAFFGVDDPRYARDLASLARVRTLVRPAVGYEGSNYVFWADPFDLRFFSRVNGKLDAAALRLEAEGVLEHLRVADPPPLHANAASVMFLAARRYDLLGRNLQIAAEARSLYGDASARLAAEPAAAQRDLFLTKYLFWEQRDSFLELVPLVQAAWEYEDRSDHLLSVLERYHVAAQRAIERASAVDRALYEFAPPPGNLPSFDRVLWPAAAMTLDRGDGSPQTRPSP